MALKTDGPVYQSQKVQNVHKRNYDEKAIESFKQQLREIDWQSLKKMRGSQNIFEKFIFVDDNFFPKSKITYKKKKFSQPR